MSKTQNKEPTCPHCAVKISEHPESRCLDAWEAEAVMGLEVYMSHEEYLKSGSPHAQYWNSAVHYPAYWWNEGWAMSVAPYSTDITAAWQVEEKIEELKLKTRYVQALLSGMLVMDIEINSDEETWWLLAHASPLDRSRAAIKAHGG